MNKKILRLAVPNILSNLSVPLLSSVDTIVVGHLEKVSYLGAIALGAMIFNFIYLGLGFLRMGTTGMTAQAYGSRNESETILVLGRSVSVAVLSAIVLLAMQFFIREISFYFVNSTPEVEIYAREYFNIRIWSAPATLVLYAFHGWFLGVQNAKYPLILSIVVNLLNVIFNLSFIYLFGMKSDGVALGTVLAQYLGVILAVFLFIRKYNNYLLKFSFSKLFEFTAFKKFYHVNINILVRTLALVFAFSFFTAKSAEYGESILAANTILINLWMIISYGIDGFAFAAESLVGKFIGAKDDFNLKKVIKYSFGWGVGLGIIFSGFYYLFDVQILKLFTNNSLVISIALSYFFWTAAAPFINSFCYIWDGVYIGATKTRAMRNAMLLNIFAVYLPLYYFTKDFLGNDSLWLAITIFMLSRAIALTMLAPKYIFKHT